MFGETGKILISFLSGFIIGAAVIHFFDKKDPVEVTVYRDNPDTKETPVENENFSVNKRSVDKNNDVLLPTIQSSINTQQVAYHNLMMDNQYIKAPPKKESDKIYVIGIDEYNEKNDYDKETLYLYADGILADEDDRIIDTPNEYIGECLNYMYDQELWVRNDILQIDYEVLLSAKTYEEEISLSPIRR